MRNLKILENEYKRYLNSRVEYRKDGYYVGNHRIMTYEQKSVMKRYADCIVDGRDGIRILEIGYGLGVFSQEIEKYDLDLHVIVECHSSICKLARKKYSKNDHVNVYEGFWQSYSCEFLFDAIFYDTTIIGSNVDAIDELLIFLDYAIEKFLAKAGIISFWYSGDKIDSRILSYLNEKKIVFNISLFEHNNKTYLVFKILNSIFESE